MPMFPTSERPVGLRFPMGQRGMYQISLRVVGSEGPPVSKTTYSNPDDIPPTSFDMLQKLMLANQAIIQETMAAVLEPKQPEAEPPRQLEKEVLPSQD